MTLYTAAFVGYQYLNIKCCNGEILKIMTSYTIFVRKSIKLLPLKLKKVLHLLKNSQIKTGIIYIYIYVYIYIYILRNFLIYIITIIGFRVKNRE